MEVYATEASAVGWHSAFCLTAKGTGGPRVEGEGEVEGEVEVAEEVAEGTCWVVLPRVFVHGDGEPGVERGWDGGPLLEVLGREEGEGADVVRWGRELVVWLEAGWCAEEGERRDGGEVYACLLVMRWDRC